MAVDTNIQKCEFVDKEPDHLNFGFQKHCEYKGHTRYLLNDREIDWNEGLKFLDDVNKSKVEDTAISSEIEGLLVCPREKIERLSPKTYETDGAAALQTLNSGRMHGTGLAAPIQRRAKCCKTDISQGKDPLLQRDRKRAVACNENTYFHVETFPMKISLGANREVFVAEDKVSNLQQSSYGSEKLTLCEATRRSHSDAASEVNEQNKRGRNVKMWDHNETGYSCEAPVKRLCLIDISGSASTYTSDSSHKMSVRCINQKCPANTCLSALSLFKELKRIRRLQVRRLASLQEQNILQASMMPVSGTSIMHMLFSLLCKPACIAGVPTDYKICTLGGSSAASVGMNVAKHLLQAALDNSQKLNKLHITLCAYLNKSQNDLLMGTLIMLPEMKTWMTIQKNSGTSYQSIAADKTTTKVQEYEVQDEKKSRHPAGNVFLMSPPVWSNASEVQTETADHQVWTRDNRNTRRESFDKEYVADDTHLLPSSGAVVSEVQLCNDRLSVMPAEDDKEFHVPTTVEVWTPSAIEDVLVEQGLLPLQEPEMQQLKCHTSNKTASIGDESLLEFHNMFDSNGMLSPDYGYWEGDDAAGLSALGVSIDAKVSDVLKEHCNTVTHADLPKTAKGNHQRHENMFQKDTACKEKEVLEKLCELLDADIYDSNRKDGYKSSATLSSVAPMLPKTVGTGKAVNKSEGSSKFQQKQQRKDVLPTDIQFQQISPECVFSKVPVEDTGCFKKAPQEGAEAKEIRVLECPHSITDSALSPRSDKRDAEEDEDKDDDDDDDDDSSISSGSSSSVITVVLKDSWVPPKNHRSPIGNQSQRQQRSGSGGEDESSLSNQLEDHSYAIVERSQMDKSLKCLARTNGPMTHSGRNCDNNERTEKVFHTVDSDQSCNRSELKSPDDDSLSENEPLVHDTELVGSVSLFGNSSESCSDLEQKLVKDSDELLVDTKRYSNRISQIESQCTEAMHLGYKHNSSFVSLHEIRVIDKRHRRNGCDTKENGNKRSVGILMGEPQSKRELCHQKSDIATDTALHVAKKKKLYAHSSETLLQTKQSEEVSRSSSTETKSIQNKKVTHKFANIGHKVQCTNKTRRKRVSESTEAWVQNTIKYFAGMQDKHAYEEIPRDAPSNLPEERDNAPKARPVAISLRKCSSIESKNEDTSEKTDLWRIPDDIEFSTCPYKRSRVTSSDIFSDIGEGVETDRTYSKRGRLVKKTSEEGNGGDLCCTFCGKLFDRVSKLTEHIGSHTLPYHCLQCGRRFGRESQLASHKRRLTCSPNEKCRYKCEGCDQRFLQRVCLLKHVDKHIREDEKNGVEKSRCKTCGKEFDQAKQLLQHVEVHVTGRLRHTCRKCGKTFRRPSLLSRHIQITHWDVKVYECDYCKASFKVKDQLRTHIYQHRKEEEKKILKQKWKVQFPSRVSSGNKTTNAVREEVTRSSPVIRRQLSPRICPDFGKLFQWEPASRQHSADHSREDRDEDASDFERARFRCNECGDNFASGASLRTHACRHLPEKGSAASAEVEHRQRCPEPAGVEECASRLTSPARQFTCRKNLIEFAQLSDLQQHSCNTRDCQMYMCEICDKLFPSPRRLSRHMNVHFPSR